MNSQIRFSKAAQEDVAGAKNWYVKQEVPDLDRRFLWELEDVLQRMESFPQSFPAVYRDVRRANLRRFPYAVFFHLRDGGLYVLGVVHHARHPSVWRRRWHRA